MCAACTLLLIGCTASRETIEGQDDSTFFPAAHLSWDVTRPSAGDEPASPRLNVELDVSRSTSEFTQDLGSGETVDVDDALFIGPASIDVSYDLWRVLLDLRASWRAHSGLGFEGIFGVDYNQLDIELENDFNGVSDDASLAALGPLVGAALFYEPIDWLRFYAEGSFNPAFGPDFESVTIQALELGAHVRLHEHAGLRAGWRQVSFEAERDSLDSDLDLVSKGPAVTLWLSW